MQKSIHDNPCILSMNYGSAAAKLILFQSFRSTAAFLFVSILRNRVTFLIQLSSYDYIMLNIVSSAMEHVR